MMIGTLTTDIFQFADTLNQLADPIELVALEPRVWLACSNAEKDRHANRGNVSTLVEPPRRDHSNRLTASTATPAEFDLVESQPVVGLTRTCFRRPLCRT